MLNSNTAMHILEILGVFICAHHLWPKGITYGGPDDWEKKYKKHSSRSKSSNSSKGRGGSSNEGGRRRERDDRCYEREYDEPRHSRRASARY
jgi:hypothetical protein